MSLGGELHEVVGEHVDPERLLSFTRVGVTWSVLAPAASGVPAALGFWLAKGTPPWTEFVTWFGAHALGIFIVTPLVLVAQRRVAAFMLARGRVRTTLLSLGLLATVSAAVLFADRGQFLFAIFPPLLYVVFKLGFAGAALGVVMVSVTGVIATVAGHGPFVVEGLTEPNRVLALADSAGRPAFPSQRSLAERRYPLRQPLVLVVAGGRGPVAPTFATFARGTPGQEAVLRAGLLPAVRPVREIVLD